MNYNEDNFDGKKTITYKHLFWGLFIGLIVAIVVSVSIINDKNVAYEELDASFTEESFLLQGKIINLQNTVSMQNDMIYNLSEEKKMSDARYDNLLNNTQAFIYMVNTKLPEECWNILIS